MSEELEEFDYLFGGPDRLTLYTRMPIFHQKPIYEKIFLFFLDDYSQPWREIGWEWRFAFHWCDIVTGEISMAVANEQDRLGPEGPVFTKPHEKWRIGTSFLLSGFDVVDGEQFDGRRINPRNKGFEQLNPLLDIAAMQSDGRRVQFVRTHQRRDDVIRYAHCLRTLYTYIKTLQEPNIDDHLRLHRLTKKQKSGADPAISNEIEAITARLHERYRDLPNHPPEFMI